ncbi:hypothetical protein [Streptomyces sp. NBC_00078]|uniref:hypothetical protein n=1 Tax=unclassified Streptomyces TaxID=2593676 RepID=UPI00225AA5F2|nr:hypothetical protein [Streptomyces sp. NBC_00078]MCX5423676.1 hypothetical protein [Streptomyces sp. NBC_00078]
MGSAQLARARTASGHLADTTARIPAEQFLPGRDDPTAEETTSHLKLCEDAGGAGTTIGVGLIIGLWAAVDAILGFTYVVYRLATRRT